MEPTNVIIKEEVIDIEKSWKDKIKCEPTTPQSLKIKHEESDEGEEDDEQVKFSADHANFVIKEEQIDTEEEWLKDIKCESSSPVSINNEGDALGVVSKQGINMKFSTDHANVAIKEEQIDTEEEWLKDIKCESSTPVSINNEGDELGVVIEQGINMKFSADHANFVIKEEVIDTEEEWQNNLKCEPSCPLSIHNERDELSELGSHGMNMKILTSADTVMSLSSSARGFLVLNPAPTDERNPQPAKCLQESDNFSTDHANFVIKEEQIDTEEEWLKDIKCESSSPVSINNEGDELGVVSEQGINMKFSADHANFVIKEEVIDTEEEWQNNLKCEPSCPLSIHNERDELSEIGSKGMNMKEFTKRNNPMPYVQHPAWDCNTYIASTSAQSPTDGMAVVNSEEPLSKNSSSPEHGFVTPPCLEDQEPLAAASCSTAHYTTGQQKAADTYFSEEYMQRTYQMEERNSAHQEEPPFQRRTHLSGSLKSSTGERPFKCCHCGKAFKRNQDLNNHVQIHNSDRHYKCSQCEKSFKVSGPLDVHMRTHTLYRLYECSQCMKLFTQSGSLILHMRTHTGDRPYKCTYCKKSFTQSGHLTLHVRTHTGEAPYKCSQCGKSFTSSSNLIVHIRSHTGERPYECSECGKSFIHGSALNKHIRTHSGDGIHKSIQCGESFTSSSNFTVHMRTNTEEGPYKCSECGKSFIDGSDLTIHMRTHTGDGPN